MVMNIVEYFMQPKRKYVLNAGRDQEERDE